MERSIKTWKFDRNVLLIDAHCNLSANVVNTLCSVTCNCFETSMKTLLVLLSRLDELYNPYTAPKFGMA